MLIEVTGMVACYQKKSYFTRHSIENLVLKIYNDVYNMHQAQEHVQRARQNYCTLYCITKQLLFWLIFNGRHFSTDIKFQSQ